MTWLGDVLEDVQHRMRVMIFTIKRGHVIPVFLTRGIIPPSNIIVMEDSHAYGTWVGVLG